MFSFMYARMYARMTCMYDLYACMYSPLHAAISCVLFGQHAITREM